MESIIVAAITAVIGPIAVLVVGRRLRNQFERVERHTSETLNQVKNSHDTNLRDDLDGLHEEMRGMRDDQRSLHGEVREVRTDITGLRRDDAVVRQDLDSLRRRVRENEERFHKHAEGED